MGQPYFCLFWLTEEQKSTEDIFYWIEEYMQNEKHPNISFPKYNLE